MELMTKPNTHRHRWLRCRANELEEATVKGWLAGISPDNAEATAQGIAERLESRAPFANVGALLRAVFDLEPVHAGAPKGNTNKKGKRKSQIAK